MTKGIIFDLYGTLIDIGNKQNPYKNFLNSLGITKDKISLWVNRILTQNFDSFEDIKSSIGNVRSHQDISIFDKQLQIEVESIFPFDDTYKTLERLSKKYRLFCLSNLATPYKDPFFKLGLDKWIEKPFFSCDHGMKKPNQEFFKAVVDYSELKISELVMIGDNEISDYGGALNAGIKPILKVDHLSITTIDL